MSYASTSDLTAMGLPATALGALTGDQQQAALDNASALMDSYFRGRYELPLLAWGSEVTQCCAVIAAYLLMNVRGFNPASGADVNLLNRYEQYAGAPGSFGWLDRVQRRAAHPDVTPSASSQTYAQPLVVTDSVIDQNGRLASSVGRTNRGW